METDIEEVALEWPVSFDWSIVYGSDIAPDKPCAERADYVAAALEGRLHDAQRRLNPDLLPSALDDAFRKLTHPDGKTLEAQLRILTNARS